jgi:hypothetical protein
MHSNAANSNFYFIVFGLTQSGLKLMIYRTDAVPYVAMLKFEMQVI